MFNGGFEGQIVGFVLMVDSVFINIFIGIKIVYNFDFFQINGIFILDNVDFLGFQQVVLNNVIQFVIFEGN